MWMFSLVWIVFMHTVLSESIAVDFRMRPFFVPKRYNDCRESL